MVTFHQLPPPEEAAKGKAFPTGLRHGYDLGGKDFLVEIQLSFTAEVDVRLIVVKIRLTQVFHVFGVVLVQFNDFLDERVLAREIEIIEKTFWIELFGDQRVSPIDRQAARHHGFENFFRGIARQHPVFKTDIEFILF